MKWSSLIGRGNGVFWLVPGQWVEIFLLVCFYVRTVKRFWFFQKFSKWFLLAGRSESRKRKNPRPMKRLICKHQFENGPYWARNFWFGRSRLEIIPTICISCYRPNVYHNFYRSNFLSGSAPDRPPSSSLSAMMQCVSVTGHWFNSTWW